VSSDNDSEKRLDDDCNAGILPDTFDPDVTDSMFKAWSYSRLVDFERCKFYAKLKYLDRLPEPERPLPAGVTEQANDRGSRIHQGAEDYVKHPTGIELLPELSNFREEFAELRKLYAAGLVSLEGEWAFDKDWNSVAWSGHDVWLRMKLDALAFLTPRHAVAIDYKTGRKDGNEIKHAEQMQLYQLGTFLRYPELEQVTVELWYLDKNDLARTPYVRSRGLQARIGFHKRGAAMTSAVDFPANPNVYSCRYCRYGPKGSGVCPVGM
jgi:RecB family exonuclease